MTEQDELSRLARAITDAEDELATTNHRDNLQQLASLEETRAHLVERIEAREKALDAAREAMTAHWQAKASEGSVKVPIDTGGKGIGSPVVFGDTECANVQNGLAELTAPNANYSNGLDAPQED